MNTEPVKVRRKLPSKWILILELLYKVFEAFVLWRKSSTVTKYYEDLQHNREVDELEEIAEILEENSAQNGGI